MGVDGNNWSKIADFAVGEDIVPPTSQDGVAKKVLGKEILCVAVFQVLYRPMTMAAKTWVTWAFGEFASTELGIQLGNSISSKAGKKIGGKSKGKRIQRLELHSKVRENLRLIQI